MVADLCNTSVHAQVCAVAAQPGHTKELQTIQLERGLKIVDSPGVVFDDAEEATDSAGRARAKGSVLLRNVIKVEDVEDPIELGKIYYTTAHCPRCSFSISGGDLDTNRPGGSHENIQPPPNWTYPGFPHDARAYNRSTAQGVFVDFVNPSHLTHLGRAGLRTVWRPQESFCKTGITIKYHISQCLLPFTPLHSRP